MAEIDTETEQFISHQDQTKTEQLFPQAALDPGLLGLCACLEVHF